MQPHNSSPAKENPLISVCIANYNGMGVIGECLSSVLAQHCELPFEIIVHDDASTDESPELIRHQFPQVKLMESSVNVGFCVSNNRMAQEARGEFLLLLNNDATLMPGALKTLSDRALELAQPAILTLPQYDAKSGALIDAGSLLDPFLNTVPNQDLSRRDVGTVIGACLWVSKILWERLGGFPEWFESIAEDTYLCCAARLSGYPVQVVPKCGFRHWVGHSLGGGKARNGSLILVTSRRRLSERNKNFVMLATYPLGLLITLLPLHIFLLIIEGSMLALIKRDPRIFIDIYWNSLKEVWDYRCQLLTLRKKNCHIKVTLQQFLRPHIWLPYKPIMLIKYGWPNSST